ncbi:glycosyltransferase [Panacibacter ginsenosidivorans]|uniref:Glycosyltransferase n=1 Tax=Panacibacter ginsenosidivorans TaxID=1813871 RepID=A0A5B8VF36_9BACT|nr:glycosyltransferase [Panacibacter ginsenosidivorans]QEC69919.1 glycosyltransferase [Panacibacter ginsenosidivorans]
MDNYSLSIIIPSYNGAASLAKNLPYLYNYLATRFQLFELIIVNDGGNDSAALSKIKKLYNCAIYDLERNYGKGAALRKGFSYAQYDYQVFTDADIPFTNECIERIINSLRSGKDIAIGDRSLNNSFYNEKLPVLRKLGSNIISMLSYCFIEKEIKDTQCGLKGFSKEAATQTMLQSTSNGFAIDFEILYLAKKKNLEIERVPVIKRNQDKSTVRILNNGIKMLAEIFKVILTTKN